MTTPAKMDATLRLLTPEEVPHCLRFVQVMKRGGKMSHAVADEWRRRILAWAEFLGTEAHSPSSDADAPGKAYPSGRHFRLTS